MNKEEIEKQAREKYPIGTRVASTGGSPNEEIIHHDFYWSTTELRIHANCALYNIRDGGQWAKVIQAVETKVVNNYQIF